MENPISQEDMQELWNEEAIKLEAAEPAPEPAVLEAAAPADAAADSPTQVTAEESKAAEPEDPLASLPPAVRDKLAQIDQLAQANAQLLHHVKTAEGRVAAMQREFEQARKAQAQVAPQSAPTQQAIANAASNPEEWENLKQDFPEWAGAMEKYVASKLAGVANNGLTSEQVQNFVNQQLEHSKVEMRRALEEAKVEGRHEDWRQTVNSTDFANWFAMQKPEVQALASSDVGKDAIRMLDLFEAAKARPASEVRQERSQRLAAAATTRPGQTPPPKTLGELSPEELWNYEAATREKTRSQRGF